MGDIGDELFLIVLGPRDGVRHVAQGGGQIAQLVLALDGDGVVHVAQRVLFRAGDDAAQGAVDIFREE